MDQLSQMEIVAESRAARQSQDMSRALSLLGHTVQWADPATGTTTQGKVTAVKIEGSEPLVVVGNKQLKLNEIMAIF
jgi:ribosomal protein L35AE/L33A